MAGREPRRVRPGRTPGTASTTTVATTLATTLALLAGLAACADPAPTDVLRVGTELQELERDTPEPARALYAEDAARLALREAARTGSLETRPVELPAELARSAYHALLRVYAAADLPARDSVVEPAPIHAFPDPALHQVIVAPTDGAPWVDAWRQGRTLTGHAGVDALVQRYGLRLERFYHWSSGPAGVLASDAPLNTAGLAARFAALPGVRYAEPNGYGGDGHDIRAERRAGAWRLQYTLGSGDCPAGCIHRRGWTFDVTDDGRVAYLGDAVPVMGRYP